MGDWPLQFCPDQGVSWDVGLSVLRRRTSQAKWDESVTMLITQKIYRNLTTIFYSISGNRGSNPFGLFFVGSPVQSLDSLMLFLPVVGTCARVRACLETATGTRSVTVWTELMECSVKIFICNPWLTLYPKQKSELKTNPLYLLLRGSVKIYLIKSFL